MDAQLLKELGDTLVQYRHVASLMLHERALTMPEMLALRGIENNARDSVDNVYADDLQKMLFVSKPAISQMLKSLEGMGYITREINPENRRKLDVMLTDEGREALHEAGAYYKEMFTRIVETFGEDKLRQFLSLFVEFVDTAMEVQREMTPD